MDTSPITVETIINSSLDKVWVHWTEPRHIVNWAFASDDWEAPVAENDLKTGGKFKTVMAAKDKSASFDFTGTYTEVKEKELLEYTMEDGRRVVITFEKTPEGVKVIETFDPEDMNSREMQQGGWQAILDNFKKYSESLS